MSKSSVSVFMLVYNQEKYVAQAIEGVLKQETAFPVELVIGDDHSSDRTSDICREFAQKNPDRIKLFINDKNEGIGRNYIKILNKCTGKYVAICDGDDYWTDSLKLQKQVDFLESNPDYEIVFTNNSNIYPSGKEEERDPKEIKDTTVFHDLVQKNYIASVTVMFRNKPIPDTMCNWMNKLPYGDWPTYLWILKDGSRVKFLNEITAVYRKNFGTSAKLRKRRSKMGEVNLEILKCIYKDFNFYKNREVINQSILAHKEGLMGSYNRDRNFWNALLIYFEIILKNNPFKVTRKYFYTLKKSLFNV